MRGLAQPSAEFVLACLAPLLKVWFGFALRCVALLCGVFVRLHLALFPAGRPFLPSLSVNVIHLSYIAAVYLTINPNVCRRSKNVANFFHAARHLLRQGDQMLFVDVANYLFGLHAQKALRRVNVA
jgi:hypothetical protein